MGVREPCRYVYLWEPSSDFVRWEFTSETAVGMLYWSYHAHDLPITETGERSLGMRLHENRWEEPGNEAAWKQVGGAWEWGCTETGGKSLGMRLHGNRWEEPGNEAARKQVGGAWEWGCTLWIGSVCLGVSWVYHVNTFVWTPFTGEILPLRVEDGNEHDTFPS